MAMKRYSCALFALVLSGASFVRAESLLPVGYTQLEYIESTGTQYIDTQYKPLKDDVYDLVLTVSSPVSQPQFYPDVFGWRDSKALPGTSYSRYGFGFNPCANKKNQAYDWFVGKDFMSGSPFGAGGTAFASVEKMHLVCGCPQASWERVGGGLEGYVNADPELFRDAPTTVYLFADHDALDGAAANKGVNMLAMKLFSCKISHKDAAVPECEFVPCMNPEGKMGLYDVKNERFCGNLAASGEDFKPGPAVDTGVPPGYTRLTYIESTDNQYINTGYSPKACDRAEFVIDAAIQQKVGYPCAFGYNNNVTDKRWWSFMVYHSGYGRKMCYNYGKTESDRGTGEAFTRGSVMHVVCQTNEATYARLDGGLAGGITLSQNLYTDAPIPIYLFGANYMNQFCQNCALMRLYSFKIYSQDNVLRRNYVPCRNPDGAVGVYESVMNQFLGNAREGGTAFAVPPEAGKLPEGYTRLKSIETTSALDAYIDVGYRTRADDRLDCLLVAKAGGDYPNAYGWRSGSSGNGYWIGFTPRHKSTGKAEFYYGQFGREGGNNTGDIFTLNKKMHLVAQTNTVWYAGEDGTKEGSITITASDMCADAPLSLYLFAMNQDGTRAYSPCVANLFSFRIFDAQDLEMPKRDYVPCKDPSGRIGVYDLVENHFYAGVGTFKAHVESGMALIVR